MFLQELGLVRETPELQEVEALLELLFQVSVHLDRHKDANGFHSAQLNKKNKQIEIIGFRILSGFFVVEGLVLSCTTHPMCLQTLKALVGVAVVESGFWGLPAWFWRKLKSV